MLYLYRFRFLNMSSFHDRVKERAYYLSQKFPNASANENWILASKQQADQEARADAAAAVRQTGLKSVLKSELLLRDGELLIVHVGFQVETIQGIEDRTFQEFYSFNSTNKKKVTRLTAQLKDDILNDVIASKFQEYGNNVVPDSAHLISIKIAPKGTTAQAPVHNSLIAYPFTTELSVPGSMKGGSKCAKLGLLSQLQGKEGFKRFALPDLEREMLSIGIDINHVRPQDIMCWVQKLHEKTVSLHMFNAMFRKIGCHIAPHDSRVASLMLVARDNHVEFISRQNERETISNGGDLTSSFQKFEHTAPVFVDCADPDMINLLIDGKIDKTVVTDGDLDTIAQKIVEKHRLLSTSVRLNDECCLDCYVHPVTGKAIYVNSDYKILKELFRVAYEKFPYDCFIFEKQSYTALGKMLMKAYCGGMPDGAFQVKEDHEINVKYNTRAFITATTSVCTQQYDLEAIDITKCFTNCALDMQYDYPNYSIFDHWQPYTGQKGFSECILKHDVVLAQFDGLVQKQNEIVPRNLFDFYLKERLISLDDVAYVRCASFANERTFLSTAITKIRELYAVTGWETEAEKTSITQGVKKICNFLVGSFGVKNKTHSSGFISSNIETVANVYCDALEAGDVISCAKFKRLGDLYYANFSTTTPLYTNHTAINRQIVAESKIKVLNLIKSVKALSPETKVAYVKTDCVGFYTPREKQATMSSLNWHRPESLIETSSADCPVGQSSIDNQRETESLVHKLNDRRYRSDVWNPPKYKEYRPTTVEPCRLFENLTAGWENVKDYKRVKTDDKDFHMIDGIAVSNEEGEKYNRELLTKSMCVEGPPGTGKSVLANHLSHELSKRYSVSNKACMALDENKKDEVPDTITIDIEITVANGLHTTINHNKEKRTATTIIVDEVFTAREKHFREFYLLKLDNPHLVFQAFGDPDQIHPLESEHGVEFNYLEKPVFRWLFGNRMMKTLFVEDVCRYDSKLKAALDHFKSTGYLLNIFKPIDSSLQVNVCVNRKEKEGAVSVNAINKKWLSENGQCFKTGDKVVANVNRFGVKNSRIYTFNGVKFADEDPTQIVGYFIDGVKNWIETKYIEAAVALTVDRYQGSSIDEPGNIHSIEKMNFERLYVALSRFRRLSDIHLTWVGKQFKRTEFERNLPAKLEMIPCKTAWIYKKQNDTLKEQYVGRTIRETPAERHLEHSKDARFKHCDWVDSVICQVLYCDSSLARHRLECKNFPHEVEYTEKKYIKRAIHECAAIGYNLLNVKHNREEKSSACDVTPALNEIGLVDTSGLGISSDIVGAPLGCQTKFDRQQKQVIIIKKKYDPVDEIRKKLNIGGHGKNRLKLTLGRQVLATASFQESNEQSRLQAVAKLEAQKNAAAAKLFSSHNIYGPSQGNFK